MRDNQDEEIGEDDADRTWENLCVIARRWSGGLSLAGYLHGQSQSGHQESPTTHSRSNGVKEA